MSSEQGAGIIRDTGGARNQMLMTDSS